MPQPPHNLLPAHAIRSPVTVPAFADQLSVRVRIQRADGERWLTGVATAWTAEAVHVRWSDGLQYVGWFAAADVRRSS